MELSTSKMVSQTTFVATGVWGVESIISTYAKETSREDFISHLADRSLQPGLHVLELCIDLGLHLLGLGFRLLDIGLHLLELGTNLLPRLRGWTAILRFLLFFEKSA